MSQTLLFTPQFWSALQRLDEEQAARTRAQACPSCGSPVHVGNYPRQLPDLGGLDDRWKVRFSFCCSRDGCRRRVTPVSVRFLGRRVHLAAMVVLLTVLTHGASPQRCRELRERVGVDRRTLARWRQWWLGKFVASAYWKSSRGRFPVPVDEPSLPGSLLERFEGDDRERQLIAMLRFLAPITSVSARSCMPI